eukprot:scaffold168019_cov25-Tisochrysis_lutea.AAC.3
MLNGFKLLTGGGGTQRFSSSVKAAIAFFVLIVMSSADSPAPCSQSQELSVKMLKGSDLADAARVDSSFSAAA